jgi:hypothetical protein
MKIVLERGGLLIQTENWDIGICFHRSPEYRRWYYNAVECEQNMIVYHQLAMYLITIEWSYNDPCVPWQEALFQDWRETYWVWRNALNPTDTVIAWWRIMKAPTYAKHHLYYHLHSFYRRLSQHSRHGYSPWLLVLTYIEDYGHFPRYDSATRSFILEPEWESEND